MFRKFGFLMTVFVFAGICFAGTAAAATPEMWVSWTHSSRGNLTEMKSDFSSVGFRYLGASAGVDGVTGLPATGSMVVPGTFAGQAMNAPYAVDTWTNASNTLVLGKIEDAGGDYFTPRNKNGSDFIDFVNTDAINTETALQNKTINVTIGDTYQGSHVVNYKTTAEQKTAKVVPYIELTKNAEGYITGGKGKFINLDNPAVALKKQTSAGAENFRRFQQFRIYHKLADGTTKDITMNFVQRNSNENESLDRWTPKNGEALEFDVVYPSGTSNVKASDVTRVEVRYRVDTGANSGYSLTYRWSFFPSEAPSVYVWTHHNTRAVLKGTQSDPRNTELSYWMRLNTLLNPVNAQSPTEGKITINGSFTLKAWDNDVMQQYADGANELKVKRYRVSGNEAQYQTLIDIGGGKTDFADLYDCEESLKGKKISWEIGSYTGERNLGSYKTTAEQLASKIVPFVELTISDKGFLSGGKYSIVNPDSAGTPLVAGTDVKNFSLIEGCYLEFSVDGTRGNRRWIALKTNKVTDAWGQWSPNDGEPLSITFSIPKGLEGVVRADRILAISTGYQIKEAPYFSYNWTFFDNDNFGKLAENINPIGETKAPDGTEIGVASVDVKSEGYSIPSSGLEVKEAGNGTAAVNAAKFKDLEDGKANLVKAAVFGVSYTGEQDGNQVLPTTMKFSATKSDVGAAVWTKISDDSTPENILKHVRVFKIVPMNNNSGTKVVDLVKEVAEADWLKIFSAVIDGETVSITANIMIRDATDSSASGKFEGVKTFGATSYLMYMDGTKDGNFKDPIALMSYETVPVDNPTNPGGGGCSAGYLAPFALLLAVPMFLRKRK